MNRRFSLSLEQRRIQKLSTELFHKIKEKSKLKILNKNNYVLKNEIKEISSKKLKILGHFDRLNNNLLHYIAELDYKVNKNTYNPEIIKKEGKIIEINKRNIISLNKFQDIHNNKLIDDKYYLENKAMEYFNKEEERENKIIKDNINKDHKIYQDLNKAKIDLSKLTKKFRKQVVKTENNENCVKDLKLKLELTKNINIELTNILNKEKQIQKKYLKQINKIESSCRSHREINKFNSPYKTNKNLSNNDNINKKINEISKTPKNPKISINKLMNINKNKSPNINIITNSSKRTYSRNNYISTTIENSTTKLKTDYLNEDINKEKEEIYLFYKLIENEIRKKEENIKIINTYINNEYKLQYNIKNLIIKCIEDINKDNKELEKRKNINDCIRKKINEEINGNEIRLNTFNFIKSILNSKII